MRIVIASSEALPFSKTGGLGDVASALPKALSQAGHDVWLVLPHYRQISALRGADVPHIQQTDVQVTIPVGSKQVSARILKSALPGSTVQVLLIDRPEYFDRPTLYTAGDRDYPDNCERFVFFSRAVLEAIRNLDLKPDIVHANDWQTGLVPALLAIEYRMLPGFERTRSIFTIHNMAFQGQFWRWDMLLTGLDWKYFNFRQMEFYGDLNLLKTGVVFADLITTVSPTYAREIQTAEFGYGLEDVLRQRKDDLVGILNGVDTEIWDPRRDPAISSRYSLEGLGQPEHGKRVCKRELQRERRLPERDDVPVFGMISRMTDQKGFGLLASCLESALQNDLQLVLLGSGQRAYEELAVHLQQRYPDKLSATIGYDEDLAHRIEAGADTYLMPSAFEPCGLNQMYSLMYGTVPIVNPVGGLADTVVDATAETLAAGTATGFRMARFDSPELLWQMQRAMQAYRERPVWQQLMKAGMRQDLSWGHSAGEYVQVYQRALAKPQRGTADPK